ncbi:MAG: hypothetical protein ABW318_01815 [Vicinamibacterales bacterium]
MPRCAQRVCAAVVLLGLACAIGSGCAAGAFKRDYEYEEELYLSLDGSATLNVNASVASLVALRGAHLDSDPRARVDRSALRTFFGAPDTRVSVSLSRRQGRRFVHASIAVDDVRKLSRLPPSAWSSYQFSRDGEVLAFKQTVGPPTPQHGAMQWEGGELVAFRMHLPSAVVFHNAPSGEVERGNILEWEQSLGDRIVGKPLDIRVQIEPTSVLAHTMWLFGGTIAAAFAAFAGVVWWIRRSGPTPDQ